MAHRMGDPVTTIAVLTAVFDSLSGPGSLAERLADTELAMDLAEQIGDPVATLSVMRYRWRVTMAAGRVEEADECLRRMEVLTEEVGQPLFRWVLTFAHACRALLSGDCEVAECLVSEAYQLGMESGQPDALVFYQAGLSYARWQQGRLGDFVPILEEAARSNPGIPGHWAAVTRALCDADRGEEARPLLQAAAAQDFAHLPPDALQLPGLVMYADAAMFLQDSESAAKLCAILDPWRDQWSYMGIAVDGPVAHFLAGLTAVLNRFDESEQLFNAAYDMVVRADAKFFTARTDLEWALMLSRRNERGDIDQARARLRKARHASVVHGYGVLAKRADTALSQLDRAEQGVSGGRRAVVTEPFYGHDRRGEHREAQTT